MKPNTKLDILRASGTALLAGALSVACFAPSDDPEPHIDEIAPGEHISVRGEVESIHGDRSFTLDPEHRFDDSEDVVVITRRSVPVSIEEGDWVYVGGVVQRRSIDSLDPAIAEAVAPAVEGSGSTALIAMAAVDEGEEP